MSPLSTELHPPPPRTSDACTPPHPSGGSGKAPPSRDEVPPLSPRPGKSGRKPPSDAFQKSFEGAKVEDIALKGDRAAARFSNREVVEFGSVIDGWLISKLGANAGHEFVE
jgi:hypothetical protein